MAADSSTLGMLGAGTSGADLVSGRPPAARANPSPSGTGARSSAASATATAGGGADGANASASQSGQSSSDGSSPSGSSINTASRGSGSSGKDGSAASGNSSGAAGGGRNGRTCGASQTGSTQPNSQGSAPLGAAGAAGNDFPAALAQSLAATTAGDGATPDKASAKPASAANASDPTEPSKGHSATDPASSALTLLEQALAGALAGIQAATAVAGTTAASTSTAPAVDGDAIGGPGKRGTAALDALLTQSLAAESKTSGSIPASAGGTSPATAAPATASTAAAGLTAAAQLSPAALAGPQQGAISTGMSIAAPVGTSAWTDELGAKVTWMAHQGIESASLHLSPEHLGPLQVSISVHDGQASVWFGAAQPDTRLALQQSLPQLRQLFATQGLTLADTGVSRDPPRGQSQQGSARSAAPVSAIGAVSLDSAETRISVARGLGLLDTYA
ncbi:MAG TPA: flagellar hook-length control protein FliK [Steroidobacteraceae bacterium]